MGWDHDIKSIKCPCGLGTIEKEIKSDDWGRIEEGSPYIKCSSCMDKYNLVTIFYYNPFWWKGDTTNYYLVPKEIDISVKYIQDYPELNDWEIAKKSFSDALIISYDFENLLY